MIYNKKGVSTIVITVIMVALVLVAVGVVWGVLSGVIGGGAEDIDLAAKCLTVEVRATAVDCDVPAACAVTLERTGTSDEAISGVKLVLSNAAGAKTSVLEDVTVTNIEKLVGDTATVDASLIADHNKVEVTVYFKDASNNDQLCSQTTTFTF